MNQFEKAIKEPIKCDICGEVMHPMYGCGWDNDRIVCAARDCGSEITFPTSTEVPNWGLTNEDDDDVADEEPCPGCFCRGCRGECMGED